MIIIALNQTQENIVLSRLSIIDSVILAESEANLSECNTRTEISEDTQLLEYVVNGSILLNIDGETLTQSQSLSFLSPGKDVKQNLTATSNPELTDDKGEGYSAGSLWINSTEDTVYVCTDPATNNANWALAAAGSGITEAQHRILRQLIHFINDGPGEGFASGAYKETTPTGPFPTSEIWWESSSKLKKIVELNTSWTGPKITQEVWKIYDTDGSTVLATVTDSISHTGPFETSRTRTIT